MYKFPVDRWMGIIRELLMYDLERKDNYLTLVPVKLERIKNLIFLLPTQTDHIAKLADGGAALVA
jgi:hypothetical protein